MQYLRKSKFVMSLWAVAVLVTTVVLGCGKADDVGLKRGEGLLSHLTEVMSCGGGWKVRSECVHLGDRTELCELVVEDLIDHAYHRAYSTYGYWEVGDSVHVVQVEGPDDKEETGRYKFLMVVH